MGSHYMELELECPEIAASAVPGQFVMLTAAMDPSPVPALPRPMAIYSVEPGAGTVTVVYAIVGRGTRRLSEFVAGDDMYVVGPLGRGFEIAPTVHSVLLIGRGIGTCSLTTVAQHNRLRGIETIAVTSGRRAASVVGGDFFREHGALEVIEVADEDGTSDPESLANRLTAFLDDEPPQLILTCGSDRLALLSTRLAARWGAAVQVSLEAHMACGIGYCHGCSSGAPTDAAETPLVCKDGPVFALSSTAT
jgi:dihydroorotate dehydrogenase electron transfer subunit